MKDNEAVPQQNINKWFALGAPEFVDLEKLNLKAGCRVKVSPTDVQPIAETRRGSLA